MPRKIIMPEGSHLIKDDCFLEIWLMPWLHEGSLDIKFQLVDKKAVKWAGRPENIKTTISFSAQCPDWIIFDDIEDYTFVPYWQAGLMSDVQRFMEKLWDHELITEQRKRTLDLLWRNRPDGYEPPAPEEELELATRLTA